MSDTREKIKSAKDLKKKLVKCPEWGVTIEVRTMKGFQRANLLQSCLNKDGDFSQPKWQAGIIINSCYDKDGNQIFKDGDEEWLMEKASAPLERLATAATNINGLGIDSLKQAENL